MRQVPIHRRHVAPRPVPAPTSGAAPSSSSSLPSKPINEREKNAELLSREQEERRQKVLERVLAQRRAQPEVSTNPSPVQLPQANKPDEASHHQRSKSESSSESEAEDEDAIAAKRKALREKLLKERQNQSLDDNQSGATQMVIGEDVKPTTTTSTIEAGKPAKGASSGSLPSSSSSDSNSDSEESDSSSSEYESESEAEEILPMPKFIPKQVREQQRAKSSQDELEVEMEEERMKEKRHAEAVRALDMAFKEERIREELSQSGSEDTKYGLRPGRPDDTDGVDEEAEYEAWRSREMHRLAKEYGVQLAEAS